VIIVSDHAAKVKRLSHQCVANSDDEGGSKSETSSNDDGEWARELEHIEEDLEQSEVELPIDRLIP
jgi:hypothetical protein